MTAAGKGQISLRPLFLCMVYSLLKKGILEYFWRYFLSLSDQKLSEDRGEI